MRQRWGWEVEVIDGVRIGVDAALELVDEAGADALTMRALARRLGVDPMALYRHVRDKDDLLGAMCDRVVVDLPELDPAVPWLPQVRDLGIALHDALVRRPALLPVLASAPATPASLAVAHDAIGLLVAAGVEPQDAATAFSVVFSYVVGAAMVAIAEPPPAADEAALLDGARKLLADEHPAHLQAAAALMRDPEDLSRGLGLLLSGIAATMPSR